MLVAPALMVARRSFERAVKQVALEEAAVVAEVVAERQVGKEAAVGRLAAAVLRLRHLIPQFALQPH